MKPLYLSRLAILFIVIFLGSNLGAFAQTTTINYTGSAQTYTVPPGVTGIAIDMMGANGGNCNSSRPYGDGGKGGRVRCHLEVTGGEVLHIYVGGKGTDGASCCSSGSGMYPGGFNGGGASSFYYAAPGGGATDIRTSASGSSYTNRLVVAGAGGGGGYGCSGSSTTGRGGHGGDVAGEGGYMCNSATYSTCYNGGGGTQSSGGVAGTCGCGTAAGGLGTGGQSGTCYYGGGGGGGYYGGGGAYGGGGGGGSSFPASNGGRVTNLAHTQGYNTSSTGNGQVIITVLCTSPGTVAGTAAVCVGRTTTLTNAAGGGVWMSSNAAIATVGTGTGVVTGVSAGVAIITYLQPNPCGGISATKTVTVNPNPLPIVGTGVACTGQTTELTDPTPGGTWSSSAPSLASIGSGTGMMTGIALGSLNITYTLTATGCYAVMPTVVSTLPPPITGVTNVCAGGATTTLYNTAPGGSWTSSAPGLATVTGSGIVTGISAGTLNVSYTVPSGCFVSTSMLVNPLPSPSTGSTIACVGGSTTLSNTGGGTWSTGNPAIASVVATTGVVTGVGAGTGTISYMLPTGCVTTTSYLVNPLPAAIGGVTNVCSGGTTTLTNATPGGIWSSSNNTLATVVPTTGMVSGVTAGIPLISYTLLSTGCSSTIPVAVSALPAIYNVSGGGGYCTGGTGVHIGLNFSNSGINYKLYNGATLVSTVGGSNSGLDFGLQTAVGTYSVIATDATSGCTENMSGTATVALNTLPAVYTVSGGGSYCVGGAGLPVDLSNSELMVNYQLRRDGSPVGAPIAGTGTPINFGAQTGNGTYTVVASNPSTGCSNNMASSAVIGLNPLPAMYTLNSGGGYCTGGTGVNIVLNGSSVSSTYQLYLGGVATGTPLTGTGSALSFGMKTVPGVYTVVATNTATGCIGNMGGAAIVNIDPLPIVYTVTGGGSYCAGGTGVHIGLSFSSVGINYQLYRGTTPVGAVVAGSNAGLDMGAQTVAGTYTVRAIDAITGCTRNMTGSAVVATTPLPTVYTVTGGGNYCSGGTGVRIGLSGSNVGISYQLMHGSTPVGAAMAGTGSALDFGLYINPGTYSVVATNNLTSCVNSMTGSATISISTLPAAYTVTGVGTSYCAGAGGIDVLLSGSDGGVRYQLYRGASAVGAPIMGTGTGLDFGFVVPGGVYSVIATDLTTGCSAPMTGTANITVNPLPSAFVMTGGGSYCDGGAGVHIGLSGSAVGINYQLFNGGGAVGGPVAGIGSGLDFGLITAQDAYTVIATDAITGCTNNMTGTVNIAINPLPNIFTVTGGGNYCLGTAGISIGLDGSDVGTLYQLYNGTTTAGSPVTGGGSSVDFGLRTAGTYTATAINPLTGCTSSMTGNAISGINPLPPVHTLTGGGAYCAGGTGVTVDLSSSDIDITYQLYYMGTPGATLAGTGSGLSYGLMTGAGIYNVVATNVTTGCVSNMSGTLTITVEPQPTVQTVTGGGAYCVGGTGVSVGLGSSDAGISYQLFNGTTAVGSLVAGTGAPVDFGVHSAAGTYTVVASPGGICATNMAGSSTININLLPTAFSLTGGGTFCNGPAGVSVGLSGSQGSVKYQLYLGTTPVGSQLTGTGLALDFGMQTATGIYSAIAQDTITGCSVNINGSMAVSVATYGLPPVHNVTGGGSYCAGGTGARITLDGSNTNIIYKLYRVGVSSSLATMAGSGTILNFGPHTTVGSYRVVATDAGTGCVNNMEDTVSVSIDPILTPVVAIAANPGTTIVKGQRDTLVASATSAGTPTYQWLKNGYPVIGATSSTYTSSNFVDGDSMTVEVTSVGTCGGVTTKKSVVIRVGSNVGVQQMGAAANINVSPNPNKGTFNVTGTLGSSADEEVLIEVADMLGHVVYSNKTMTQGGKVNERIQLDNTLANGMYLLSLRSGTEKAVFHVMIGQ